jgi:cytochrome c553
MSRFSPWGVGLLASGVFMLAAVPAAEKPPSAVAAAPAAKPADAKPSAAKPSAAGIQFFESKIRPVLVAQCYECHSAESKSAKGGLVLDTRNGIRKGGESGPAVVPGNVKQSLLIEAIRREGLEMPPKEPLPETVVADFVRWVEMGAPDPREGKAAVRKIDLAEGRKHWAYQPVGNPTAPQVKDAAWPRNDFDRYVLATLEAKDMQPVADADPLTWLRRVSFDLTGLPPTPAEIAAFQADHSEKAKAAVVDRLLASPQFGERWGRHWLDIARFAESTGKERNIPFPVAWRYRDYVIDSFNADKPYDRFITEQVAGDLLPAKTTAEKNNNVIATGFLAIGPKSVNDTNEDRFKLDEADEQIDVVCRTVMATTAACARCHDHKFDPIPQTDYYALAGIFFRSTDVMSGVVRRERGYVANRFLTLDGAKPASSTVATVALSNGPGSSTSNSSSGGKKLSSSERKKLENELAAVKKKIDKLKQERQKGKAVEALRSQAMTLLRDQERLLAALGESTGGGKKKGKQNGKYNVEKVDLTLAAVGVREGKPADCALRVRGEFDDLGATVPRGFLSVLKSPTTPRIDPSHSGRLELARWLTAKDNPLTARVMANRVWFHLFGAGIVESLDNFGSLGEQPSHPELLDALARDLMDHGWSVKHLIREVVLSRAYGLSSAHDDANYAVDPSNRLVWRMNRRRLDAEVLRDTALAAAGTLDLTRPVGSPVSAKNGEVGRGLTAQDLAGNEHARSVYLPSIRGATPEMLAMFDVADSSLVVGQREVTTVATQALFMMNSPFIAQQADAVAQRLSSSEPTDEARRVDLAYRLILARPAQPHETARAVAFVRNFSAEGGAKSSDGSSSAAAQVSWSALCQALLSSAEFRYAY